MPKATLTFDLPEEQPEFDMANKSAHLASVIMEYDNWLRSLYKYEGKETVSTSEAREKLRELTQVEGVQDIVS